MDKRNFYYKSYKKALPALQTPSVCHQDNDNENPNEKRVPA